jgi:hypothetical protein
MSDEPSINRLYELLPIVHSLRDAENGQELKAILRVIAEQVNIVEQDIARLYDNWFIETCDDWVVPYIGDLIGYRPVSRVEAPEDEPARRARPKSPLLVPRREVANTLHYRRRKGTLALLEQLANQVAGWPARAVEFYRLLAVTQTLDHLAPERGRTVDLRRADVLDRIGGPFDESARAVDVRRLSSALTRGKYSTLGVGLFVWRLRSYPVTSAPAYRVESAGPYCFTFSIFGDDVQLFTCSSPEADVDAIAGEVNVPDRIRPHLLEFRKDLLYGKERSFAIYRDDRENMISADDIIVADLRDWRHPLDSAKVAVDPRLGRITFHHVRPPKRVWVSYHYGFSADIGGGEYDRPMVKLSMLRRGDNQKSFRVSTKAKKANESEPRFETIMAAVTAAVEWLNQPESENESNKTAVIEIVDKGEVFTEQLRVVIPKDRILCLRAANRVRPVLRQLDYKPSEADSLTVVGNEGARLILDGFLIAGRGIRIEGPMESVTIRHSTLIPGWMSRQGSSSDDRRVVPALELVNVGGPVHIQSSILGGVVIDQDSAQFDPLPLHIEDSIIDAGQGGAAICGQNAAIGRAALRVERCTVLGATRVHELSLGENTIFNGHVLVACRQKGCVRFCYVLPESRTPRRYGCQPHRAERAAREAASAALREAAASGDAVAPVLLTPDEAAEVARVRLRPAFGSTRYGASDYCQLADCCAEEIRRGADDESEMGVFHDLYQPQREANLAARLDEYTPARVDAGIIHRT